MITAQLRLVNKPIIPYSIGQTATLQSRPLHFKHLFADGQQIIIALTLTPILVPSIARSSTLISNKLSLKKDKDGDIALPDAPKEIKVEANETLKVALPNKYDSNRKNLKSFILQVEIYFNFNEDKFDNYIAKSL